MTFPRIFSRDHASRVEAERLRHENKILQTENEGRKLWVQSLTGENEALRSLLKVVESERDHYKAENTRFLDLVQSRNLAIQRLTEECTRLHHEAIAAERERQNDRRFCKKNCIP